MRRCSGATSTKLGYIHLPCRKVPAGNQPTGSGGTAIRSDIRRAAALPLNAAYQIGKRSQARKETQSEEIQKGVDRMARKKVPTEPRLRSWDEVDRAMKEIMECEGCIEEVTVDLNRTVAAAKEEADKRPSPPTNG